MRILLIEDDRALCQVLQPTLEAAGFASDCCHNGADRPRRHGHRQPAGM